MLRTQIIAICLILFSCVNYTMSSEKTNKIPTVHTPEITDNQNQSAKISDSQPAPAISYPTSRKGRKRRRKGNITDISYKTFK